MKMSPKGKALNYIVNRRNRKGNPKRIIYFYDVEKCIDITIKETLKERSALYKELLKEVKLLRKCVLSLNKK